MKSAFFFIAALIAYGSLYPFDLSYPDPDSFRRGFAALFDISPTGRGDVVGNLVLFMPFGLTGVLAFGTETGRAWKGSALIVGGISFAALLQFAQIGLPTRDPSGFDIVLNALGIGLGVGMAYLPPVRRRAGVQASLANPPLLLIIGALWPLAQLLPLIPTIDAANLKDALEPVLYLRSLSATETLLSLVAWLSALWLLTQPPAPGRWARRASLLPLLVLVVQPFILGGRVTPGELTGSLLAATIWLAAGRRIGPVSLGFALLAALLAANLLPWQPSHLPRSISLLPFSGFLDGDMLTNSEALLEKVFLFSAAIWLIARGGLPIVWATVTVTIPLAVQELLQTGLARGTPEITDPLLAALLGILIATFRRAGTRSGTESQAQSFSRPQTHEVGIGGIGYLPGLNGLRAIAALSVFAVHLQQMASLQGHVGPLDLDRWLTNGNTGVALFFVLSGFLLALPFLASSERGVAPPRMGAYFVRRITRILPAYYLCLFALVAIDALRGQSPSINNLLSHLLFVYNINDWQILSFNDPFWTLAVEVQFYLLLPFLVLALRPLPRQVIIAAVVALAVATYLVNRELVGFLLERNQWPIHFTLVWPFAVYISGPDSFVLTYSTLGHLTFFLIGVALAALYPTPAAIWNAGLDRASWTAEALFWLSAVTVFVILATPLDEALQVPFGRYNWPHVPILLALLILATPHTRLARAMLEWRPLWALGVISYGIYIFHYPILQAGDQLMRRLGLDVTAHWRMFALTTLAATAIVSSISYLLIERPVMRWARGAGRARNTGQGSLRAPEPPERDPAPAAMAPPERRAQRSTREAAPADQWARVLVHTNGDHWALLREFARAHGLSPSGAVRLLAHEWLFDDVGSPSVLAHAESERSRSKDDRKHWCEVNLRQQHLPRLERRLEEMDLTLTQLLACLIEHRRASRSVIAPQSSTGPKRPERADSN